MWDYVRDCMTEMSVIGLTALSRDAAPVMGMDAIPSRVTQVIAELLSRD